MINKKTKISLKEKCIYVQKKISQLHRNKFHFIGPQLRNFLTYNTGLK